MIQSLSLKFKVQENQEIIVNLNFILLMLDIALSQTTILDFRLNIGNQPLFRNKEYRNLGNAKNH